MIVTEPSLNEILHVCDMARALVDTEDQNAALQEPIDPSEVEIVQKVVLWAEALEGLTPNGELDLAVAVLKKHGFDLKQYVWGEGMEKVLTISTCHIMQGTAERLNEGIPGIVAYDKEDYGWWVWCGIQPDKTTQEAFPDDLWACLDYARKLKCDWLCLDRDADAIPALQTWEW